MIEKRPKRRRASDNPYRIFKRDGKSYLTFLDGAGITYEIAISDTLFDQFNQFELDDLVHLNAVQRHYEHSVLTDASLNARAFCKEISLEDMVLLGVQKESLHRAIRLLPEKQKHRLLLYYFSDLTYAQIAALEGCTITPIKQSIDKALAKLKKLLT